MPNENARSPGLGNAAARGATLLGLSQAVKVVTMFASTVIVVRLLSPADYGVIAMVAPIASFILIFQSLGLGQAVVQRRDLTADQINAVFWFNIFASLAIALSFVALSPLVAMFYGDRRPGYVIAASGLTVVATGVSLLHVALLNRQMRFGALSAIDMTVAIVSFAATVLSALILRTYWALVIGPLVGAIAGSLLAWFMDPWRPSIRVRLQGARSLLRFGVDVTGFNLLNQLSRNIDNVLIAKVWGAVQLGLYDRSYRLMMFPLQTINQPLSRVMLPALSSVLTDPVRYRRMFLFAVRSLVFVTVPGALVAAACSEPLVVLLLGERWLGAAPIFFWLALAASVQSVSNATGWLFISSGQTRSMMNWGVASAIFAIGSIVIGLPWGATGVAAAYAASEVLRIPILYRWSTRNTSVNASDLYAVLLPSLAAGAAGAAVVWVLKERLEALPLIACGLVAAYTSSVAFHALSNEGRDMIARSAQMVRSILSRGRSSTMVAAS
ncbi:MAG: lipopolysaccharide biosynthesis protein [Sphingobium sp.]|uniref:lipopolysaccharide biosynthesis protein n=1 Tax=Sphingobium sp. TaxID=1912891 RepID=UPI0029B67B2E|nr:lipopolysaccharide biosynthesis protein [Sphingobium sp.]MDX3908900.1 lipopolysaccharide biosynthesis protein [Sphingobium sp.]